ncbi:hypothetical protein RCL1_009125 [Eukaryota sp. TZLM3-RCL]
MKIPLVTILICFVVAEVFYIDHDFQGTPLGTKLQPFRSLKDLGDVTDFDSLHLVFLSFILDEYVPCPFSRVKHISINSTASLLHTNQSSLIFPSSCLFNAVDLFQIAAKGIEAQHLSALDSHVEAGFLIVELFLTNTSFLSGYSSNVCAIVANNCESIVAASVLVLNVVNVNNIIASLMLKPSVFITGVVYSVDLLLTSQSVPLCEPFSKEIGESELKNTNSVDKLEIKDEDNEVLQILKDSLSDGFIMTIGFDFFSSTLITMDNMVIGAALALGNIATIKLNTVDSIKLHLCSNAILLHDVSCRSCEFHTSRLSTTNLRFNSQSHGGDVFVAAAANQKYQNFSVSPGSSLNLFGLSVEMDNFLISSNVLLDKQDQSHVVISAKSVSFSMINSIFTHLHPVILVGIDSDATNISLTNVIVENADSPFIKVLENGMNELKIVNSHFHNCFTDFLFTLPLGSPSLPGLHVYIEESSFVNIIGVFENVPGELLVFDSVFFYVKSALVYSTSDVYHETVMVLQHCEFAVTSDKYRVNYPFIKVEETESS